MIRAKKPENGPIPLPSSSPLLGGSWMAGFMIGSAVLTLATGAMVMGAGMAVKDATLKGR